MSRASERSAAAAASLGLSLEANARAAVADAEVVLLAVTSESLLDVVRALAPHLKPEALLADLTASSADATRAAAAAVAGGSDSFVDVAVMGAVSLHGIRTPLLAAGPAAPRFAGIMNALGFNVEPWPGSTVGDASDLKLLRSVFTKRACSGFTKTSARFAPPAPNRCVGRSSARVSTNGATTSRGSTRSRTHSAMHGSGIPPRRSFDSVAPVIHSGPSQFGECHGNP
jgi:hypothetical protein